MNHKADSSAFQENSPTLGTTPEIQFGSSACLELQLESFCYGNSEILGELSFSISPGETVALTGPSGIGKTTMLRVLAGLETNFTGTLSCSSKVGMVFQEPILLPWRNARDNLCLATGIGVGDAAEKLHEVGLAGKEKFYPRQLSLGQQRRLSLARAFAVNPDILLMDEPFVSLDVELVNEMMELFVKLKSSRKLATVIVTHSIDEVAALATRTVELEGSPARIVT